MKNNNYSQLAEQSEINLAVKSLNSNNITTFLVDSLEDARSKLFELLPEGREVMTATSTTLDQIGVTDHINDSGKYDSVKTKLNDMDRSKDGLLMQKLGAAPEYVIGSVHAVTQDGKVIIASGSGSQLPAYSFGASKVIWIVSTKKIVKNLEEALDRIYTHVLPQEDKRMKKVYGPKSGSNPNKLLILNRELNPERIKLIFVKKDLGF